MMNKYKLGQYVIFELDSDFPQTYGVGRINEVVQHKKQDGKRYEYEVDLKWKYGRSTCSAGSPTWEKVDDEDEVYVVKEKEIVANSNQIKQVSEILSQLGQTCQQLGSRIYEVVRGTDGIPG